MSRLDEIKARADAATVGPWSAKEGFTSDPMIEVYCQTVLINPDLDGDPIQPEAWADAEFIAAAREDVPWLLDLVDSLTAERDSLAARLALVEALAEAEVARLTAERDELAATHARESEKVWKVEEVMDDIEGSDPTTWERLRAALAGSEADTTDTRPTDQEVSDE